MSRRHLRFDAGLFVFGCLLAGLVAWMSPTTGDYWPGGHVLGDGNPAPAIAALAQGHFGAYLVNQPVMGLVSILLRVPAALLVHTRPGHPLLEYRVGTVLCLCPAAVLAAWLARLDGRREWKAVCALLCLLVIAGPVTVAAINSGHPEEVLAAVLAIAAVIAAQRQRQWWAGVMLGLAIGTKQWAILAALPVFMRLDRGRWKAAAVAAAAVSATEIGAIVDPSVFLSRAGGLGALHVVNPYNLWWQLGSQLPSTSSPVRILPLGLTRSSATLLVTGLGAAAATGWWLRRPTARLSDPLALLAALLLLRVVGDPYANFYYFAPCLIAATAWEAYSLRRPPLLGSLGAALVIGTYDLPLSEPALANAFLVAWTLGAGAYLAGRAFSGRTSGPPLTYPRRRLLHS